MTQNEEREYDRKRCSELAESAFDTLDDAMLDVDLALEHCAPKSLKKARELLTSEEGLKHRGQRCIEPEAVFGQEKWNMGYRRFRHFGKDKITMDFAFFAIAFNI